MNADHTVTAIYDLPPGVDHTLTVHSSNPGSGVTVAATPDVTLTATVITPGTLTYPNGQAVTVTAPPTAGINIFERWQRDGVDVSTNQTYAFIMTTNYTVTAFYIPPPPDRILTVHSSNPGSGVTITATPDITLTAAVSTPGTLTYSNGVAVSVFAPLMAGVNTFQRWQRNGFDVTTNLNYGPFIMSTNYNVTAFYVYIPGTIPDPDPSPSGI